MDKYFGYIFVFISKVSAQGDSIDNSTNVILCPTGPDLSSYDFNLHLISFFVVLLTSSSGALIPVITKRLPGLQIPRTVFFITKHFGTGVILATAFVHMLPTAFSNLQCVDTLSDYDAWPGVIAMLAAVFIFFIEYTSVSYYDSINGECANDDLGGNSLLINKAQIVGIAILELGICFHSVIIGLALSVSTGADFISLFIALVFHQMFEGLGLGSRIAELDYPDNSIKPWLMSFAYGITTPIGIAIGLSVRNVYNPASQMALAIQGILDSLSAGILLYSALVGLMANDYLHDIEFRRSSKIQQLGAFTCLITGIFIMSLI
ncbi:11039_t:CDS:2, partial [Scutellospora calospora]